jgi:myo-inositol 2-dehydrogenase/D-chiro-inositol 1-dehydrogenase
MGRMRFAIVGAGRRGAEHARAAGAYPGATLVAVADPDLARAERLAAEGAAGARAFADHRRLLDETRPDVVFLASPPFVHAEQALDALDAGCALLIEKPLALDLESVRRIGERADQAGRLVYVGLQHRYAPGAARAREVLAGRPVGLVHQYLYKGRPDVRANWRRDWGGGMVLENQIHGLDLCRFLVGEVASVYARYADHVIERKDGWDTWDSYALTLRFAGGAVGSVAATYNGFRPFSAQLTLDIVAAGVVVRYNAPTLEVFYADGRSERAGGPPNPTLTMDHAFLRAVQTGDRSALVQDFQDAARSLEVGLAANRSAATGEVVHLDHPGRTRPA